MADVSKLLEQARSLVATGTGTRAEFEQLRSLVAQAEGEPDSPEKELLGWQVDGFIAQHGSALAAELLADLKI